LYRTEDALAGPGRMAYLVGLFNASLAELPASIAQPRPLPKVRARHVRRVHGIISEATADNLSCG